MDISIWKTAFYASGSIILCGFAYQILKKDILFREDTSVDAMLFYGGTDDEAASKKAGFTNLKCIVSALDCARYSIDVCVPSLLSKTLQMRLIGIKSLNRVNIRVVVHNSDDYASLLPLVEQQIEVKVSKCGDRLGHEFILIDTRAPSADVALAVTGSLDYEVNRVNCNRDATMLTSERAVLTNLQLEFERVWNSAVYVFDHTTDMDLD